MSSSPEARGLDANLFIFRITRSSMEQVRWLKVSSVVRTNQEHVTTNPAVHHSHTDDTSRTKLEAQRRHTKISHSRLCNLYFQSSPVLTMLKPCPHLTESSGLMSPPSVAKFQSVTTPSHGKKPNACSRKIQRSVFFPSTIF